MTLSRDATLRRLGQSLREIDPAALALDGEEGAVRWFQGEAGTDLFVWSRHDGHPYHWQLLLADRCIDSDERLGLRTGQLSRTPAHSGGRFDPYFVLSSMSADRQDCLAALVVLEAWGAERALVAPFVQALERCAGRKPSVT